MTALGTPSDVCVCVAWADSIKGRADNLRLGGGLFFNGQR
jgi:hypothetical protein